MSRHCFLVELHTAHRFAQSLVAPLSLSHKNIDNGPSVIVGLAIRSRGKPKPHRWPIKKIIHKVFTVLSRKADTGSTTPAVNVVVAVPCSCDGHTILSRQADLGITPALSVQLLPLIGSNSVGNRSKIVSICSEE